MQAPKTVEIFLEDDLLRSAKSGDHNFLRRVSEVLSSGGLHPAFRRIEDAHDCQSPYSLIHMKAPVSKRGLVFRGVYHYPFWQIEQTDRRWHWDVAKAPFDPKSVDTKQARQFARFWRNRLFPDVVPSEGDHIYVPLQGKLLQQRSFQSTSPVNMLETVLKSSDDPIVAALHPNEVYSSAEKAALGRLAGKNPMLKVVTGGMLQHLPSCKLVVTQNSSVAFNGYFLRKPTVLFAEVDFHHIAEKADGQSVASAMERALSRAPKFDKYLWWFWQYQSINAGKENAHEKIRARFKKFGWPLA